MGVLLAFAVGYLVGGRAGTEGLDEVKEAARAVLQSEEFKGLGAALRSHAGHTLTQLGAYLSSERDEPLTVDEVIERLRRLGRERIDKLTSNAS